MASMRPTHSYSIESINEVCSSTASLSVSSSSSPSNPIREYDSPTVVSYSSSTAHSDQFEDAPEEHVPAPPSVYSAPLSAPPSTNLSRKTNINPLDALAMACAAEKEQQPERKQQQPAAAIPVAEGTPTAGFHISQNDVLCGRGGLTNHHPGNVFFRRLVRIKQEIYLLASKREKAGVAREIVDVIRMLSPSGRFLKKDPQNPGHWIEIGDRKAREKTSQALREGAPELREELNTDKLPVTEEPATTTCTTSPAKLNHANARSILDNMRHHQAQTWQQMTSEAPIPPAKPPTVNSNRIRIVSSDLNLGVARPTTRLLGTHRKMMLPLRQQRPSSSSETHVIMDDQRPSYPANNQQQLASSGSYHHPQPDDMDDSESTSRSAVGSKRKSVDLATSSSNSLASAHSENSSKRGPRLKLLKQRLQSAEC